MFRCYSLRDLLSGSRYHGIGQIHQIQDLDAARHPFGLPDRALGLRREHHHGEALNLLKVETIWTGIINNADALISDLQTERLASAERLAGTAKDSGALAKARGEVDADNQTLRRNATSEETRAVLTADMESQLQTVFEAIDRLQDIRRKVDERQLTPAAWSPSTPRSPTRSTSCTPGWWSAPTWICRSRRRA
ncbi:nitrate- and nitrite sensing domain-containing protein [Nonomuraea antimicrobica]